MDGSWGRLRIMTNGSEDGRAARSRSDLVSVV